MTRWHLLTGFCSALAVTTVPLTASAICGGNLQFNNQKHLDLHQGAEFFSYDAANTPLFSTQGSVWNNSSTTSLKLMLPLSGSYGHPHVGPLVTIAAVVYLAPVPATPTPPDVTCVLRAYDTAGTVWSDTEVSAITCTPDLIVTIPSATVMANVRCQLPAKTSTQIPEILRVTEVLW